MHGPITNRVTEKRSASGERALANFCASASTMIATVPETDIPRRIIGILPSLLAEPSLLLEAEALCTHQGYARNPVFICPKGKFSIFSMVWPAGAETPIHDHRSWCAMGVYEGEVEESFFSESGPGEVNLERTKTFEEGGCSALPWGRPNIHKISNRTKQRAISIHIYGGNCIAEGPNLRQLYELST